MGARYHVPQPDYPHETVDGHWSNNGAPSKKVSPPQFGMVAFASGLPVKASQEAINTTNSREMSFAGKTRGSRPNYSPGPSVRASQPGVHSGTSNAKNLADVHTGTRSVAGPAAFSQAGQPATVTTPAQIAARRMKPRPVGTPPTSMGRSVQTAIRRQAGVPSVPTPAKGIRGTRPGQAPAQGPQGKVPVVMAPVHTAPAPKAISPTGVASKPPMTFSAPAKPTVGAVTGPTTETRSGRGHF